MTLYQPTPTTKETAKSLTSNVYQASMTDGDQIELLYTATDVFKIDTIQITKSTGTMAQIRVEVSDSSDTKIFFSKVFRDVLLSTHGCYVSELRGFVLNYNTEYSIKVTLYDGGTETMNIDLNCRRVR